MASNQDIPDVLVIGAGASGAAMVWSLAEAGIDVLCLEQGDWLDREAFPATNPDSQLHWQTDFHPDPSVRRLPEDYPVNSDSSPIAPYMYNAVGGSTVHYGSHYPRFHPSDFRVRTLDGVADDWPLTYDELEPYFDLNDRIMGVSGLRGDPAYPPKPERPCPPLSIRPGGEVLAKGFDKLGWHWWASDTAIPSVEYDGREPDSGGYLRSLASTDLTYWPKALELGRTADHPKARVREILVDNTGKATGVLYYDADGNLVEQKAKSVVMACNGIGTPRLLLNSTSPLFPDGSGQQQRPGRQVPDAPPGRRGRRGVRPVAGYRGRLPPRQHHAEPGVLRDRHQPGLRARLRPADPGPRRFAAAHGPRRLLGERIPWGERHHQAFDERFGHTVGITIMTEDLPEEHNLVTLDPRRDRQQRHPGGQGGIHRKREHQPHARPRRRAGEGGDGGRRRQADHDLPPAPQRRLAPAGHGSHGRRPEHVGG